MTVDPTLAPKTSATTALLAAIGIVTLGYLTLQLPKPVADAGWRHDAAASAPDATMAATQMRARTPGVAAITPTGEPSIARSRN